MSREDKPMEVHGLEYEGPPAAPPPDPPTPVTETVRPFVKPFLIFGCLGAIVVVVGTIGVVLFSLWMGMGPPKGGKIAVVPFEFPPDDAALDVMDDKIVETLGDEPLFEVTPLDVAAKAAGDDAKKKLQDIGTELGVRYLVQAKVTRDGENVRAAVQLVHIEENHLVFSDSFVGPGDNLAVVQTKIVTRLKQEANILSGGSGPVEADGGS